MSPQEIIEAGDKLIFSGDITRVGALDDMEGLSSFALDEGILRQNLTEVIVMPNATIEGKTIKNTEFRSQFDAAVIGLHRGGKRLSGKLGEIILQAGDSLMLATGPDFHRRKNLNKNFTVISDEIRTRISSFENYFLVLSLLIAIVLATFNILPLIKGLAFVLAGMLLMGTLQASELRRRFPFELMLIVVSALVFAQALNNTGLAGLIADGLHRYLPEIGLHATIAAIFLVTLLLTEVMTNNAAAALSFPIAFSLAESFGVNHMPFVMVVAFGASASFLTPYGYNTNLLVQNLGGYRLTDYIRSGLPLSISYGLCVTFLVPVFFPF